MNDNLVESQSINVGASVVDLEELVEIIWCDLHGKVDPAKIRQVLVDLQPKYQEDANLDLYPNLDAP